MQTRRDRRLRLSILLAAAVFQAEAPAQDEEPRPAPLAYEVELVGTTPPVVEIRTEIPPRCAVRDEAGDRDQCTLRLPTHWGGATGLEERLVEPKAFDAGGRALDLERLDAARWRIRGDFGGQPIELRYRLSASSEAPGSTGSSYYHPQVFDDHLHLIGHTVFVYPEGLDHEQPRAITLRLQGFARAGWTVTSSLGADPEELRLTLSLSRFRASLLYAGDLRTLEKDVHGGRLVCALRGSSWDFADEDFAELAADVIEIERLFFGDDDQPHYLISVLPIGGPPRSSMGGTGLTNSFGLFLSPGYSLDDTDQRRQILILLAHELLHHWNGQTIRLAPPDAAGYWFSEGFTDYFCRRILREHDLLSEDEYRAELNQLFANYFRNPQRNAPNQRIQEAFFRIRELGDLPYQRGHLIALWLDHEVREHSQGDHSLAEFFQELCWECADSGEQVDTESLIASLSDWVDEECITRLRRVVIEGETPPVNPEMLAAHGTWSEVDYAPFELGFDSDRSLRENLVSGVRPGSPAHAAGLRDGQKIVGMSIHWNRPEMPVKLQVEDEAGRHDVEYLPRGDAVVSGPFLLPLGNR